MSDILLSISRGDMVRAEDNGISFSGLWGAKILMNERYASHHDKLDYNYVGACAMSKARGAESVILDAKLSADTPEEMSDAVSTSIDPRPNKTRPAKATHITADYLLPERALHTFMDAVRELKMLPVLVLPTSRYTKNDIKRFATDSNDFIMKAGEFCAKNEAILMIGACDAKTAKRGDERVHIIGVGSALDTDELSESGHTRPTLIEDCAPYVDIFAFGSAIFNSTDTNRALRERQEVIKRYKRVQ